MAAKLTVFTPNTAFTGWRNAGKHSAFFEDGVAKNVPQESATILVENFGYYCPELYPEHVDIVKALRNPGPGEEIAAGNDDKQEADKVEFIFDRPHKIGKNEFAEGETKEFKLSYAEKLAEKGIGHIKEG